MHVGSRQKAVVRGEEGAWQVEELKSFA